MREQKIANAIIYSEFDSARLGSYSDIDNPYINKWCKMTYSSGGAAVAVVEKYKGYNCLSFYAATIVSADIGIVDIQLWRGPKRCYISLSRVLSPTIMPSWVYYLYLLSEDRVGTDSSSLNLKHRSFAGEFGIYMVTEEGDFFARHISDRVYVWKITKVKHRRISTNSLLQTHVSDETNEVRKRHLRQGKHVYNLYPAHLRYTVNTYPSSTSLEERPIAFNYDIVAEEEPDVFPTKRKVFTTFKNGCGIEMRTFGGVVS